MEILDLLLKLIDGISNGEILTTATILSAFVGFMVSVFCERWVWFKSLSRRDKSKVVFFITIATPLLIGALLSFRNGVFDENILRNSFFIGLVAYAMSQLKHASTLSNVPKFTENKDPSDIEEQPKEKELGK